MRAKRMLAGMALVFLVSLVNGCGGCGGCRGERARGVYNRVATLNRPQCYGDSDCIRAWKCPPEDVPICADKGNLEGTDRGFCACDNFRLLPSPDGGEDPILGRCVRNPDGGTPICGEWDAHRRVIMVGDGGVIVIEHGGEL